MPQILEAIIIAIIQGLTEWLPVSSSGHLVLAEKILNYQSSLTFTVALHFGTLMAVFIYFGKDITDIIQDFLKLNFKTENAKLGIYLIIATIPAAIIGYLLRNQNIFHNLTITTLGFGITGLFLIIASLNLPLKSSNLNKKNSLYIGLAQILSLFPGISRSGSTISSGLLLGLKEKTALKFSFLMSIPIIFGANILVIGNQTLPKELIWATLVSFLVGLLTLHILYKYILTSKRNLRYFGIYALILSISLTMYIIEKY
jgi:undecaprenyl-diphosphatase